MNGMPVLENVGYTATVGDLGQLSQPRSLSLADRLAIKGALALAREISKIDCKKERLLVEYFGALPPILVDWGADDLLSSDSALPLVPVKRARKCVISFAKTELF